MNLFYIFLKVLKHFFEKARVSKIYKKDLQLHIFFWTHFYLSYYTINAINILNINYGVIV